MNKHFGNSPADWRRRFRTGAATGKTGCLAPGFQQANLAVVPAGVADDFEAFLHANATACPLLARGAAGDPALPALGADLDVRSDLSSYNVYRNGRLEAQVPDISELWRGDMVAFAAGCSLTFESHLVENGIELRGFKPGVTCATYDTSLPNCPKGPFRGNMVVSMRAVPAHQVDLAAELTSAFPEAHGGPVFSGDPNPLGVDLSNPISGEELADIHPGEVPVFWACGVSLLRAIESAGLDLAFTHTPGHMLITDLPARGKGA